LAVDDTNGQAARLRGFITTSAA
jgi:hypothetical protein